MSIFLKNLLLLFVVEFRSSLFWVLIPK
jgi:hypothetical protein